MKWIKPYPVLIIIVVASVPFLLAHWLGRHKAAIEMEMISSSNMLRKTNNVPIIENNWIKETTSPNTEKWYDGIRGISTSHPFHLYKEISFVDGRVNEEKDAFHFEATDSLQYRLIFYHIFEPEDSVFVLRGTELIVYQPGKLPPSHSTALPITDADSVLRSWGIAR